MQKTLRIVVIEDDPATNDWVCNSVGADPRMRLVGSGTTLAEGQALLRKPHDVIVVDLGLPDGNGLDLVRRAAARPETHCLILTVFGDNKSVLDAIEAGADGYVLKDTVDIPSAIFEVAAGQAPLSPAVAAHVLHRIRGPRCAASDEYHLTPRETDTLEQLARGLSYQEAGEALGISHYTVADHVKMIYKKLAVNSRGGAVYKGLQAGLIEIDTP